MKYEVLCVGVRAGGLSGKRVHNWPLFFEPIPFLVIKNTVERKERSITKLLKKGDVRE